MIQIEQTPNPDSLKFLSPKILSTVGTEEFKKKDENNINNSFVKTLLKIKGVELVLMSDKFLTVKKTKDTSWDDLKPTVISHLNDYLQENSGPILTEKKDQTIETDANETVTEIKRILETMIRPAVARDGGDIKFHSFDKGILKVKLQGSCSGCPSSLMTLKQGVQNLLKHYVKEVNSVEAV